MNTMNTMNTMSTLFIFLNSGAPAGRSNRSIRVAVNIGPPGRGHTNSGHGTMVDLTVRIAIASATARAMPSSLNG